MYKKWLSGVIALFTITLFTLSSTAYAQTPVYRDDLGDVTGSSANTVYSTLDAALSAISSNPMTLVINRELAVTSNDCIVPSNVHLLFMKSGSLRVDNGKNVTINGAITAPNSNIFICNDTIIQDCENAWNEQAVSGVINSSDTTDKQVGDASAKLVMADNASVGILASKAIQTLNIKNSVTIYIWLKSSIALNSGDLQLLLDDTANCVSPIKFLDIKSIEANTWVRIPIHLGDASGLTSLVSIGIKQTRDLGGFSLWLDDIRTNLGVRFGTGSISEVHPEWFLPSNYVKDGSVDYSYYMQQTLDSLKRGTVIMPPFSIKANMNIIDKTDYRITGHGATIKPFGDYGTAFNLVGTINKLTIDSLSIEGEANSSYHTRGIGNSSDQLISNVSFNNLNIKGVNIAIALDTKDEGDYDKTIVSQNIISGIKGTGSNQGLGIRLEKATNCIISENIIDNCSVHSIYINNCTGGSNIISKNVIKDHRKDDHATSNSQALSIVRSSGIIVSDNTFLNNYDGGIEVAHVTSSQISTDKINIIGNHFIYRKNIIPDIIIGEQLVPESYYTSNLLISGNSFRNDQTICGGGDTINIFNGRQLEIKDNMFFWDNVTGTVCMVSIGHDSYVNQANDCTDIDVSGNFYYAQGSDINNTRGVYMTGDLCNMAPNIRIKDNYCSGIKYPVFFGATPSGNCVNTLFKIKSDVNIDFGNIPANSTLDYTVSINGVKPSSIITVNPGGNLQTGLIVTGFSHQTNCNTVIVRMANTTVNAIDPPGMTFKINVEDE